MDRPIGLHRASFIIASVLLSSLSALAQCDPDVVDPNDGWPVFPSLSEAVDIKPDSITFSWSSIACAGFDYSADVLLASSGRTVIVFPVIMDEVPAWTDACRIMDVNGLPVGFSLEPLAYDNDSLNGWANAYGVPGDTATIEMRKACIHLSAPAASVSQIAPATGFIDVTFTFRIELRIAATYPDLSGLVDNGSWLSIGSFGLPTSNYTYTFRVYSAEMCPVSVAEAARPEVLTFPNPAQHELRLTKALTGISIVDMYGKVVHSSIDHTDRIDISPLPDGVYLLRFGDQVRRFVVRR